EVKNYSINYIGPYSSVYGSFEKMPLKEEPKTTTSTKNGEDVVAGSGRNHSHGQPRGGPRIGRRGQ
ncbi:MAG: hypothetical protein EAZ62_07180, partial [Sphingobacteriia bacterium]